VTPKQAAEALSMLDNLLTLHPLWSRDEEGLWRGPTKWETVALFRLRSELMLRTVEPR
jgi:hypothetical protein